jgi:hypothetical protein
VNQLGDQNVVGGRSSNCFGLVPGQQLGAIALADPFDQGLPVGELLSRWWWRLDRHTHRLTRAASLSAIDLAPPRSAQLCTLWRRRACREKGVLHIWARCAESLLSANRGIYLIKNYERNRH